MLGIEDDVVPAIAINSLEMKVEPYDKEKGGWDVHHIRKWLDKFVKGELKPKTSGYGEIKDFEIKYALHSTLQLTRMLLADRVYEEGKDVLVFIYSSGKVIEF